MERPQWVGPGWVNTTRSNVSLADQERTAGTMHVGVQVEGVSGQRR